MTCLIEKEIMGGKTDKDYQTVRIQKETYDILMDIQKQLQDSSPVFKNVSLRLLADLAVNHFNEELLNGKTIKGIKLK